VAFEVPGGSLLISSPATGLSTTHCLSLAHQSPLPPLKPPKAQPPLQMPLLRAPLPRSTLPFRRGSVSCAWWCSPLPRASLPPPQLLRGRWRRAAGSPSAVACTTSLSGKSARATRITSAAPASAAQRHASGESADTSMVSAAQAKRCRSHAPLCPRMAATTASTAPFARARTHSGLSPSPPNSAALLCRTTIQTNISVLTRTR
jgi:hypothetical protein